MNKCYGFDLLWKEWSDSWFRELDREIEQTEQKEQTEDIKKRLRYLKNLRDTHTILLHNPESKHGRL